MALSRTGQSDQDAADPPRDLSHDLRGTWAGDELQRARTQIDALAHAVETLRTGMRLQQEEVARLADLLQTVDGRTQRHESGQEIAREVRQAISTVQAA